MKQNDIETFLSLDMYYKPLLVLFGEKKCETTPTLLIFVVKVLFNAFQ